MEQLQTATNSQVLDFNDNRNLKRSDAELAQAAVQAMKGLQEAMDDAIRAGLLVEPNIKRVENRFASVGVSSESYLLNLHILRQLS